MCTNIVYTAFDGDHMVYIDCMREIAIKNGYIPVNPEHALGYYLATRSHNDSKYEVMKDCLSLSQIANEFWVFSDKDTFKLTDLPEGVVIEILLWLRKKNGPIKFFTIKKVVKNLSKTTRALYKGDVLRLNESDIIEMLEKSYFQEISDFIDSVYLLIRPVIYVDIRDYDYKYVDWIRAKLFASEKVPAVPQHLIPRNVYDVLGKSRSYQVELESLREATSGIWAVYHSSSKFDELKKKYADHLSLVTFVSLREAGVPKYANPRNWSITTRETQENLAI